MKWRAPFRVLMSVAVSVLTNIAFVAVGMSEASPSKIGRFVQTVSAPGGSLLGFLGLVTGPHTPAQIFGLFAWLVLVIIYDAALLWVILSLPIWWRHRA